MSYFIIGSIAMPFGSITTGLGIKSSDADCFIRLPDNVPKDNPDNVLRIRAALQRRPNIFANVVAVPMAATPIVKFRHVPTDTYCDVSVKSDLGVRNSLLAACFLQSDPKFSPAAIVIKYWARTHELSGTGRLTNYALLVLFIFYLQRKELLPPVCRLQSERNRRMTLGWDTEFSPNFVRVNSPLSLYDLIGHFFKFYADFDFDKLVVCPFLGVPISRASFVDSDLLPAEFRLYKDNVLQGRSAPLKVGTPICIQDPFEHSHNIASCIFRNLAAFLKEHFKFAATTYERTRENENYNEFLRTILLSKPILPKDKTKSILISERLIQNIREANWSRRFKEIVMIVMRDILTVNLVPQEQSRDKKCTKVNYKYEATLTRPVFDRKAYDLLFANRTDLTFLERQKEITKEILKSNKGDISLQFSFVIIIKKKKAALNLYYTSGDIDAFIKFHKFLSMYFVMWFFNLVKSGATADENGDETEDGEELNLEESINVVDSDSGSEENESAELNEDDDDSDVKELNMESLSV